MSHELCCRNAPSARWRAGSPVGILGGSISRAVALLTLFRIAAALALYSLVSAHPASAQCPDGTPPPCGTQRAAPVSNSVAVLYFDNLSSDSTDIFLADGLTEELIIRLTQVQRLQVRSRFAAMRFRGHPLTDARAVGRAMDAAYLVTGSLQQTARRVRLRIALVRATNGATMWGEIYDRAGGDILAIQSEVAREVAGAITGRLLPQERASLARRPTRDPVAYNLYLRGVGAANTTSEVGMRAGLDYFDRAIERDSTFADAYVQRAIAWIMLADGYVEGRVGYARARDAAERALRWDSSLATAYAVLAEAAVAVDADAARGERLATRALGLDPRSWLAHNALMAALFLSGGRNDSAVAEARRGWEADTLSAAAAVLYLWTLSALEQGDSLAAALARMHGVLSPEDLRAFDGVALLARGNPAAAAERLSWSYYGGIFAAEYVRAQLALGRTDVARAAVDSMVALSRRGYYNAFGVARAYAALGDTTTTFAWLARAWEQRTIWLAGLRSYVELAPLHADPRWAAFLSRMGVDH